MIFKECFSKNNLGICIKIIRDTDSRIPGLLQTSWIGISGVGPESTCLTSSQAILRFLVSFMDQAVLMHSEEWLELCGSLLSMMCVWQSSLLSSLAPFAHSHLPDWPKQEFVHPMPGWEPSGFCAKGEPSASKIADLLTDVSGNVICLIYFSLEKN